MEIDLPEWVLRILRVYGLNITGRRKIEKIQSNQ
jgi:hypothetical protein